MKNKKHLNYFIIQRLDQNEESDCLSNIYDLSILNKIKEIKGKKLNKKNKIKNHFNSIIKSNELKQINQNKKTQIIQVIKKTILSTNLTYKWKLITFKQILIFFHIFILISGIAANLKDKNDKNGNKIINQSKNDTYIDYNISHNFNDSFNDVSIFENNATQIYIDNNTYLENNKMRSHKRTIIISIIINQIILIPIWFIFIYKYQPKWDRINDILFKFTSHLLIYESYESKDFFYYLMKDYSILITKKKYYLKYLKSSNKDNKDKYFLPISQQIENYNPEKNIFLYSINIINDFILEDFAIVNYYQLISTEDYNDINVLIKYIENNLHEKIKKFSKKIMFPTIISLLISIYYNRASNEYIILSTILVFIILLLMEFIIKEYFRVYKQNVDKFIDNYNDILIPKKRFMYRKNRLIMFLALKDNIYTKNQIIKAIEKIINS